MHQSAKRLLNEAMKERPVTTTIAERTRFLQSVTGKRLSYSTIRRALKRLGGWSRKKDRWGLGARRAAESRPEGVMVAAQLDPERLVFSWTSWEPIPSFLLPLRSWAPKGRRAYCVRFLVTAGRTRRSSLFSMSLCGMGPSLAVEGPIDRGGVSKASYVESGCPHRLCELDNK